tara:strand:+ start:37 stop:552 length:516 start_codon:yes stop_codon:yes gene_type:complete
MALTQVRGAGAEGLTLSTTDLKIDAGDLVFSTANKGVVIGATSNTDANTLDDYEEGTWTPSLGGNTTYTNRSGVYRKVGGLVFIFGVIQINAIGTGSTQVISGLPFASTAENTIPLNKLENSSFNFYSAQLRTSLSSLYLSAQTALDGSIAVNQNYFQNNTEIQFSGCYFV